MDRREYNVVCRFSNGRLHNELWTFEGLEDKSTQAIRECLSIYEKYDPQDVPIVLGVECLPSRDLNIDFQLLKDMSYIRSICDLGRKIRATNNLAVRQPLSVGYVYFSDYATRSSCQSRRYIREMGDLIEKELNINEIIFINDVGDNSLFDVILKPNFRSLGPKGYGKLAQPVKKLMEQLPTFMSNSLYERLLLGPINDFGFPISLEDVEVGLKPKEGLKSLSNDCGAIILDTRISPLMKRKGLVYNVKSCIQQCRRALNLDLQDYVNMTLYSRDADLVFGVEEFSHFLKNECLIDVLNCYDQPNVLNLMDDSSSFVFDTF